MLLHIADLPRKFKIFLMLGCDVILLPLALWSAIGLRLGVFFPDVSSFGWLFLCIPFLTVPIFIRIGLYRAVVRYMDDKIIYTIFYGVTISVLLLITVVSIGKVVGIPRSSFFIYWVIAIAYITTSRFVARGLLRAIVQRRDRKQKVAIYGAGRAGLQTALALLSGPEFFPIAFFDDNPELHGTSLAGIRVYSPDGALAIMDNHGCRQLLLAIPSASRSRKKEIIRQFEGHDILLKTIPGMGELVDGSVRIEDIREVGVEDLLGRDPVPPFEDLISQCIKNQVVFVTGAGGSIGSELCRQLLLCFPKKLILYEQNEFSLYKIEQELQRIHPNVTIVSVLGNVMNQSLQEHIMKEEKVDTVYHAAAYKHVPLVETNIVSGVSNNVFGTHATAQAAINAKVKMVVLISTDKAVRPTNVMGASKRLAEMVIQALAKKSHATNFCMVRFGNVLASSGSVVPLFKEQIRNGGPVTVTHPEVTRYFMTIPEAAQLVLQAGSLSRGGDVFVLDMGEPIKILDLAKKIIELSGLEVRHPETGVGDIAIQFVGLRQGEKLYEELLIGEKVSWTKHPRIMRAEEAFLEPEILFPKLEELKQSCELGQAAKAKELLKGLVKEYQETQFISMY